MSDTSTLDPETEVAAPEPETETSTDGGSGGDETEAAPVAQPEDDEPSAKDDRRPRGWLETDVKAITDKFVAGEIKTEEDKPLTPHRLSRLVKSEGQLDAVPSTGAVAAVLKRWVELDFCVVSEKPFAFVDYTDLGREKGLKALKEQRSENAKAARAAAKAEAAPAETEAAPEAEPVPA